MGSGLLSVDIEWGSGNGYMDLSSDVDYMNLHGPTEDPAPENFMQSAEALVGLDGFDPSATSGSFVGQIRLSISEVRNLLGGGFNFICTHSPMAMAKPAAT